MDILVWLVPPAVVTVIAMVWASWAGRPQHTEPDRSEAATQRFAKAIMREHPTAGRPLPQVPRERSTGIAVRPSRTRRSA